MALSKCSKKTKQKGLIMGFILQLINCMKYVILISQSQKRQNLMYSAFVIGPLRVMKMLIIEAFEKFATNYIFKTIN